MHPPKNISEKCNGNSRTAVDLTVNLQLGIVTLGNVLDNGKAKTRTACFL